MSYTVYDLNRAIVKALDPDYEEGFFEGRSEEYQGGDDAWEYLSDKLTNWGLNNTEVKTYDLEGIGTARKVEDYGGEGQGDDYWIVVSITDADGNVRLFERTGYYQSYDGGYLDGPTVEVEAVEKTVTAYRPIAKSGDAA